MDWHTYRKQRLLSTNAAKKFKTEEEAKNFLEPIIAPDQPIIIDMAEHKHVWGFNGYTIEYTDTNQIKITLYTIISQRVNTIKRRLNYLCKFH